MDSGTGLAVLGGAVGSKELIIRILGPTADYLGAGMRDWTERKVNNVGRVFENASKKLGNKLETPGAVPPKVLKGILEEAPFCDDELSAEYFGGVLASSRTEVGRDDRGAAFTGLIGRLSSYQIRSHYFFYSAIRTLYEGSTENIGMSEGRIRLKTFVPISAYVAAMEFGPAENILVILAHVMFGLAREALIENQFLFGSAENLRGEYANVGGNPGILFVPSALGVELFLWAHGRGDLTLRDILSANFQFASGVTLKTTPGICSTIFPERVFPRPEASAIPTPSPSVME